VWLDLVKILFLEHSIDGSIQPESSELFYRIDILNALYIWSTLPHVLLLELLLHGLIVHDLSLSLPLRQVVDTFCVDVAVL